VQNARRKQQLLDDWRVLQVPRPRGARAPRLTAAAVWPGACLEAPCQCLTCPQQRLVCRLRSVLR